MVEQRLCNPQVASSNLAPGSDKVNQYTSSYPRGGILVYMESCACLYCGTSLKERWQKKFCSNHCQANYQYKIFIEDWLAGNRVVVTKNISRHIKRFMIERDGEKCSVCGWKKKHPITLRVPLEVDHVDGNADNNVNSNLQLLCPNCHSLTLLYRNLNKGNGRSWRNKPDVQK